jgi:hypothetical protein
MRYNGTPTVIADARFQNQLKIIQKTGGKLILVKRGELPSKEDMQKQGAHKSEWDWMGWTFDYTVENDGTKEDLYAKVDALIVSDKITNTPAQPTGATQPLAIGANSF